MTARDAHGDTEPADEPRRDHAGEADDGERGFDTSALVEAFGGTRGLLESTIPGVVFALVFAVYNDTIYPALSAAVVTAVVILIVAIVQRRSVQQTISGFLGILFAAGIVLITGRARDFFLVGLWRNAFWLAAHAVSALVRWPLVGLLVGPFLGEGVAWRRDPARLRAYLWCTAVWIVVFGVRLGVQLPLFSDDRVVALGVAQVFLGLPLFLLACLANYLILRRVPRAVVASGDSESGPPSPPPISAG